MPHFNSLPDPAKLFGAAATQRAAAKADPKAEPKPEAKVAPKQVNDKPVDATHVQTFARGTSTLSLTFASGEKSAVKFPDKAAPAASPPKASAGSSIDSRAVFFDSSAATGKQLDAVLKHYRSPHAGKGEIIAKICREEGINPILMLAMMQQESSFGNRANLATLKDENIANPWSVHFNEGAKGIAKLRLKDGSMPSFEQSLRGGIATIKKHARESSTPLSTAGKKYSVTPTWAAEVIQKYKTQAGRIAKMK